MDVSHTAAKNPGFEHFGLSATSQGHRALGWGTGSTKQ